VDVKHFLLACLISESPPSPFSIWRN